MKIEFVPYAAATLRGLWKIEIVIGFHADWFGMHRETQPARYPLDIKMFGY